VDAGARQACKGDTMRFGPEDMTPPPEHDLSAPAQQERKPLHTEAEVHVLLNMCDPHYSRKAQEKAIRRILGVPAP
jgi:hypothetical protein